MQNPSTILLDSAKIISDDLNMKMRVNDKRDIIDVPQASSWELSASLLSKIYHYLRLQAAKGWTAEQTLEYIGENDQVMQDMIEMIQLDLPLDEAF